MPTNYTLASRPTATPMTGRPEVTTNHTTRPLLLDNTVSPIVTGLWDDTATWTETLKFWNDSGNTVTTYTSRIIP